MQSPPTDLLLGGGIYTFSEASKLTGIPARSLRRWLRGYRFKGRSGETRDQRPVFERDLPDIDGTAALSFLDLVEAMFVHAFVSHGVSWKHIRESAEAAAEMFDTAHPFCVRRFETDGRKIFATVFSEDHMDDERMVELVSKQAVFREVFRPLMRQLEFDLDTVARWRPLGPRQPVVVDPQRSRGVPVTEKGGVPTRILSSAVQAENGNVDRVARWYQVPAREVQAAVKLEGRLAA